MLVGFSQPVTYFLAALLSTSYLFCNGWDDYAGEFVIDKSPFPDKLDDRILLKHGARQGRFMIRKAFMLGAVIAAMTAGAGGEVLFVPADGSVVTSAPLSAGQNYIIEARGTYGYKIAEPEKIADAEWAYSRTGDVWTWVETPGAGDLDLYVDGADISMMGTRDGETFSHHVFSPGNVYRANVFGSGASIALSIYDERYDDNSGGLDVTIRPAAMGDTNVDDVVSSSDYENLVAQFGGPPGDQSADFNGDGIVDLDDFAIQRANLGLGVASAPAGESPATTPEPATLIMLLVGGLPLLLKRKRKSKSIQAQNGDRG